MFLRRPVESDLYKQLAEKVKGELIATLKEKGVNISRVQVDMKPGNLNVEVLIAEQ